MEVDWKKFQAAMHAATEAPPKERGGGTPPALPEDLFFMDPDGTPILLNLTGEDRVVRVYIAPPGAGMPPALSTGASQEYLETHGFNDAFNLNNLAASGVTELSEAQRASIERAIETYARLTGLRVEYVTSPEDADMTIAPFEAPAYNPYGDTTYAQTILPRRAVIDAGIPPTVFLNMTELNDVGDDFDLIVAHEIGHIFGFKHPINLWGEALVPMTETIMISGATALDDGTPRRYPEAFEGSARLGRFDVMAARALRQWVQYAYPDAEADAATALHTGDDTWNLADIIRDSGVDPRFGMAILDDGGRDVLAGTAEGERFTGMGEAVAIASDGRGGISFFGSAETVLGGGGDDHIFLTAHTEYVSADQGLVDGVMRHLETMPQVEQADTLYLSVRPDSGLRVANDFEAVGMAESLLAQVQDITLEGGATVFLLNDGREITVMQGDADIRFFIYRVAEDGGIAVTGRIALPENEEELAAFLEYIHQQQAVLPGAETARFAYVEVSQNDIAAPETTRDGELLPALFMVP